MADKTFNKVYFEVFAKGTRFLPAHSFICPAWHQWIGMFRFTDSSWRFMCDNWAAILEPGGLLQRRRRLNLFCFWLQRHGPAEAPAGQFGDNARAECRRRAAAHRHGTAVLQRCGPQVSRRPCGRPQRLWPGSLFQPGSRLHPRGSESERSEHQGAPRAAVVSALLSMCTNKTRQLAVHWPPLLTSILNRNFNQLEPKAEAGIFFFLSNVQANMYVSVWQDIIAAQT